MKKKKIIQIIGLIVADLISTVSGFYIASLLRNNHFFMQDFYIKGLFLILVVLFATLLVRGSFTKVYVSYLDEMLDIFIAFLLAGIIFMSFTFVYKVGPVYSRLVIGFGFLFSLIIDVILRYVARLVFKKIKIAQINVLVIGGGKTGEFVTKSLKKQALYPYHIVGILDDNKLGRNVNGVKVIGKLSSLSKIALDKKVEEVIFAITTYSTEKIVSLKHICDELNVGFEIVPNIFGVSTAGAVIEDKQGILLVELKSNRIIGINAFVKRSIDMIGSLMGFLIFSPLFIIIPILIKLDTPGPILFVGKRIGRNGNLFDSYKFRSMFVNGDDMLNKYLEENPKAKEEWIKYKKLKTYDPRVTKIGKWIRKTSFDELPQLINVLKGDMSIVGPRPYLPREKEELSSAFKQVTKVRPGFTGLWVISGRNDLTFEERIILDIYYIENWSLWMDIKIILRTFFDVLIKRKGAY
jgi:Undecaprenyl-phosphate galactose phosphotransferase WbaP